MERLCANLSTLFTGLPLDQRFDQASSVGFSLVEVQYPYELSAFQVGRKLDELGQELILVNAPLGREPERRGLAALAGHCDAFRTTILEGLDYATTLGCGLMHVLSGVVPLCNQGVSEATWLANMAWAAEEAGVAGVTLVIEALNHTDVPGYFLQSIDHAATLINQVQHPNLKLLFDTYHCEMADLRCVSAIEQCIGIVGHVQIADCPGRGAPGSGNIDWERFFAQLVRLDYRDAIGLEFRHPPFSSHTLEALRRLLNQHSQGVA